MTRFHNSAAPAFFDRGKTYAQFPVWSDSQRGPVKFRPLGSNRTESRRAASKIFHNARRFECRTRKPGRQDGAIGRNGILILHTMLFDFIDYATGRLDPGYQAIAYRANISVRSVHRGLAKLKAAGVLNWIRRVYEKETAPGSRWEMAQDTNAYSIITPSQWKGYTPPAEPPPPEPGTHGAPDRVVDPAVDPLGDVAAARRAGASIDVMHEMMERSSNPLLRQLARTRARRNAPD